MKSLFNIVGITLVTCALTHPVFASELQNRAHPASAKQYQVLHENEHVLVLKMTLAPGEADAQHHHYAETVYFERGGRLRIAVPDQAPVEVTVPDGHVMWHEAWTHQVTNIGDSTVVALIVESQPSLSSSKGSE